MPTAIQQYHSAERAAAQRRFASSSSRFEARSRREGRRKRIIIADATMQVREHPRGAKRLWSAELQFRFQVAHKLQASWTAAPVKAGRDWKAEMNLRTPKLLCDRQGGRVSQWFSVAVRYRPAECAAAQSAVPLRGASEADCNCRRSYAGESFPAARSAFGVRNFSSAFKSHISSRQVGLPHR